LSGIGHRAAHLAAVKVADDSIAPAEDAEAGDIGVLGVYILKVDRTGTALLYSTLLGGAGANGDTINALAVDAAGEAYVTGAVGSADFPITPGAYQTVTKRRNAFVTKLDYRCAIPLFWAASWAMAPDWGSHSILK
jgi:hypothetical protein